MGAEDEDVNMLDDENSGGDIAGAPVDQERRIRREIANSNERRRMQSINAGFQSLRTLLPHHEGEKLSKAAILQQTAEYIYTLEQEKTRLLQQNSQLKRLLALSQQRLDGDDTSPQLKKKRIMTEGETNIRGSDEDVFMSGQVSDLNLQLIQEQRLRLALEERLRTMETQLAATPVTSTNVTLNPVPITRIPTEESRTVVSQELTARPPASILLSEPLNITQQSPAVQEAVDLLPSLTAPPPPAPAPMIVVKQQLPSELPVQLQVHLPIPASVPATTVNERNGPQELTESNMAARSFILTTTTRQNLDSIVEAIRHLEGDHLFSEDQQQQQQQQLQHRHVVKEEISEYSSSTPDSGKQHMSVGSFPSSAVLTDKIKTSNFAGNSSSIYIIKN